MQIILNPEPDHNFLLIEIDRSGFPDMADKVIEVRVDHSPDGGGIWSPESSGEQYWSHDQFPHHFTVAGGGGFPMTRMPFGFMPGLFTQLRITVTPLQPLPAMPAITATTLRWQP